MPAKAAAEWRGDLKGGTGTFTAGDTISGSYSVTESSSASTHQTASQQNQSLAVTTTVDNIVSGSATDVGNEITMVKRRDAAAPGASPGATPGPITGTFPAFVQATK